MIAKAINSLIRDLEAWKFKAINVARILEREAKRTEPLAVVGEQRFTLEGWIAGTVRAIVEDGAGIDAVIADLEACLDTERERGFVLQAARAAIVLETHRATASACLAEILGGTSSANSRRDLLVLVKVFGRGDPARAAETLHLDPEKLARAMPLLWQQAERDQSLTGPSEGAGSRR